MPKILWKILRVLISETSEYLSGTSKQTRVLLTTSRMQKWNKRRNPLKLQALFQDQKVQQPQEPPEPPEPPVARHIGGGTLDRPRARLVAIPRRDPVQRLVGQAGSGTDGTTPVR
jgi:hypothetical protein